MSPAGNPTSRKQGIQTRKQILVFINQFQEKNGWPPTYAEIAHACGIGPTAARKHCLILEKEGHLRIGVGARQIAVIMNG